MSSILKVDQLQDSGGNNLVTSNGSGVITSSAFGKVLQVVQTVKTDTFTTTSTSFTDITGMSVAITPASTSSKIFVMVNLSTGNTSDRTSGYQLLRGSTPIGIGDSDGSNRVEATAGTSSETSSAGQKTVAFTFLDSPSTTSATTYKVQVICQGSTQTTTINRSQNDSDNSYNYRTISTITVMEILA